MANPTPADLHAVNVPLTNFSVAYMQEQDNFIAHRAFPVVSVPQQSNRYYVYNRADWNRAEARVRAPATESAGGGWTLTTDTYFAEVWGIHKDNSEQDYANADTVFNLDSDATRWVTQQMLLRQDIEFVNAFFGTGKWTGDQTGVAAAPAANQFLQWNDANSTPVKDIRAQVTNIALRTGGFRPNTLILGPQTYQTLLDNPSIVNRIQNSTGGMVTTQLLAQLFDVERVLVAWSVQNTAAEGAAESSAFMLGKGALLVYSSPTAALRQPTAGIIFAWSGNFGATGGVRIKRFAMDELSAIRIEGESWFDMKLVDGALGVFFATAVA